MQKKPRNFLENASGYSKSTLGELTRKIQGFHREYEELERRPLDSQPSDSDRKRDETGRFLKEVDRKDQLREEVERVVQRKIIITRFLDKDIQDKNWQIGDHCWITQRWKKVTFFAPSLQRMPYLNKVLHEAVLKFTIKKR